MKTYCHNLDRWIKANCAHIPEGAGASVAQWVKCWPTDLADSGLSLLEAKSSHRKRGSIHTAFHYLPPIVLI